MKSRIMVSGLALLLTLDAALAAGVSFTGTVSGSSRPSGHAAGAHGANASVQAPGGGGGSVPSAATASVSVGSARNLDAVIELVEAGAWSRRSISRLKNIEGTLYHVSAWISADNRAAFEAALNAHYNEIKDLQAAVYDNFEFDAWLAIRYAEALDVVAIGVAADGSLAVFVR